MQVVAAAAAVVVAAVRALVVVTDPEVAAAGMALTVGRPWLLGEAEWLRDHRLDLVVLE